MTSTPIDFPKSFDPHFWQNKFERIVIDEDVADSPVALRFRKVFPNQYTIGTPPALQKGQLSPKEFGQSKKQIHLTRHKGTFFKRCPGNQTGLACCNYFVLNLGFQCDMDCSYCYLQSFINSNYLTVYTNGADALQELDSFAESAKDQPVRVGTGEVIDSLSLDPLTGYSTLLIDFFARYPKWTLEFKTKSSFVDQFVDHPHSGNVTVSWSINPPKVIDSEEHGTASFEQRLLAARKCADKGFALAFHIDPVVWHPHWQESYGQLVDTICERFDPDDIPYISLGALRFQPEQKGFMRERFGMESMITRAETFKSSDGKLRYDYGVRQEMFQFVINRFKFRDARWKIFLCMESPESWNDTFGKSPHRQEDLQELFTPIPKPKAKKAPALPPGDPSF